MNIAFIKDALRRIEAQQKALDEQLKTLLDLNKTILSRLEQKKEAK